MNSLISSFVHDALSRGVPREEIIRALQDGGWDAKEINAALDWLVQKTVPSYLDQTSSKLDLTDEHLRGLPFIPSRKDMFVIPAALFLASIFGRSHDSELLATYQHLSKLGLNGGGLWLDKASTSNVLRAIASGSLCGFMILARIG